MTIKRTLEFYGFVKGDPNLIEEGLRVRVLDTNLVDRTDNDETFLVRRTEGGFVYQVRALGDEFADTPTDTQTGLYNDETFYIVFQKVDGLPTEGQPGRHPDGRLFTYQFRASATEAINVDLYLSNFVFNVTPPAGSYIDRPTLLIDTDELNAKFLVTFNGEEPVEGQVNVAEVLENEPFTIPNDGQVTVRIASVDQFGNVAPSVTLIYDIEYPTVNIFEPVTLQEIITKRFFYREAYLIGDDNRYILIPEEEVDLLISEAQSNTEALDDLYYVPLEPGINNGTIFGPRLVRLASNRSGTITNQIVQDGKAITDDLVAYNGEMIELSPNLVTLKTEFVDSNDTSTGIVMRSYRPVEIGPVIEQVQLNNGETELFDPNVTVNVLTKGGAPQVITIGQNPMQFPVNPDDPVIWNGQYYRDCQYLCDYGYGYGMGYGYENDFDCDPCNLELGYGYGYDRRRYITNWCFTDCCDTLLHTAFNEQTAYKLCEEDGEQCVYIRARSFEGISIPLVVLCVNLNLDKPTLEIDPVCTELKQTANTYQLSGLKGSGDAVWINGKQIIPPDDTVLWSHTISLSSGDNTFSIYAVNSKGVQSEVHKITINYEFVFTGIQTATVRADAEGNWEVVGIGFNSPACEELVQVWQICAETPDQCAVLAAPKRIVYIVEDGMEVDFVSPQHRAPVCESDQKVEFNLVNSSPLEFYGPYTTTADGDGVWELDGVAVEPATFSDSTDPNIEIVATALNQDSTEHSSSVAIHVQVVQSVELQLDGCVLGQDFSPPFNDYNCLELKDLADGKHTLTLVVNDFEGFTTRVAKSFVVDTKDPAVEITSPLEDEGIYTSQPPILTYTVDKSAFFQDMFGSETEIPLIRTSVYIDGENVGEIRSGERLPPLSNGTHTIRVEVESFSRDEERISDHICDPDGYGYGYGYGEDGYGYGYGYDGYGYGYGYGYGPTLPCRIGYDEVTIEYLRPIDLNFGATGDYRLNIGNDIDGRQQAEAIFDEFRILNRASSDADIFNDWRLLLNGLRFSNSEFGPEVTEEQSQTIEEEVLDSTRLNLPRETLVLMHFDNSYQSEPGIDNRIVNPDGSIIEAGTFEEVAGREVLIPDGTPLDLKAEGNVIIDERAAINQLAIDVLVERGEPVDRDLILESIDRIIPARGEALVEFVEVEDEE